MKWLLTGGAGFIGTNLAIRLVDSGEACLVTDNLYRPGARWNRAFLSERYDISAQYLDVRFADQVNAFFEVHDDVDVVVHLAGQVSLVASIDDPRYDFDTNAAGTLNVLEAMRRRLPRSRLIYASTNKIYGDLQTLRYNETETRYTIPDYPSGFPETLPVDPHGCYSCSKAAADQYVRDYWKIHGLKTVALRQSSIYGINQYATEDQGWVAWFIQMAVQDRRFSINGTGKQVRDLLDVADLSDCFLKIAYASDASPAWGEAFNIGGGPDSSLSLLELFAMLQARYGLETRYTADPPRSGDQKVFIADTSKARPLFNWKPAQSLETGLDRLVAWSAEKWGRPAIAARGPEPRFAR